MLEESTEVAVADALTADILIVGGGLAGLTLAREMAQAGKQVAIFESGGITTDPAAEDLNDGVSRLHGPDHQERDLGAYLRESRCRRLGGSGNLWGGKCAELDPIDFEHRRWIRRSGWPFSYEDLKPYLDRACFALEIPVFNRQAAIEPEQPRAPLAINSERVMTTGLRRYSAIAGKAPQNHFDRFVRDIAHLPGVTIYLHATVVELLNDPKQTQTITGLRIQTPSGLSIFARGQRVVLAAGGLENARLLLTGGRNGRALGSKPDLIGRYFMGHVMYRQTTESQRVNTLELEVPIENLQLYLDKDPTQLQGTLQLARRAQKRYRLPNTCITLEPRDANSRSVPVFFMSEQQPNPDSRVTLDEDCDANGVPRLRLDWRFTVEDFAGMAQAVELMGTELQNAGIGRLNYAIDQQRLVAWMDSARHHMGTTRMHEQPDQGVVDANCRVHGQEGLYVAGTSVFPTGGISNPTLSIIALTLRLADHLLGRGNDCSY